MRRGFANTQRQNIQVYSNFLLFISKCFLICQCSTNKLHRIHSSEVSLGKFFKFVFILIFPHTYCFPSAFHFLLFFISLRVINVDIVEKVSTIRHLTKSKSLAPPFPTPSYHFSQLFPLIFSVTFLNNVLVLLFHYLLIQPSSINLQ